MLYDDVGGARVLRTAVIVFQQRVLADPGLAPWFAHVDVESLRVHQHAFLTATLGGPNLYSGRQLGEAHAGLHVTAEAFDRMADHLTGVLRDLGVDPVTVARVSERIDELRHKIVEERADTAQSGGSATRMEREGSR